MQQQCTGIGFHSLELFDIQNISEIIYINGYFKTKTNVMQGTAIQIVMQLENQNAMLSHRQPNIGNPN